MTNTRPHAHHDRRRKVAFDKAGAGVVGTGGEGVEGGEGVAGGSAQSESLVLPIGEFLPAGHCCGGAIPPSQYQFSTHTVPAGLECSPRTAGESPG